MESYDNSSPHSPNPPVSEEPGVKDKVTISGDDFPVAQWSAIHNDIRKFRWVVPVQPCDELEVVLLACIKLAKSGMSVQLSNLIVSDEYARCPSFNDFCTQDLNLIFKKLLYDSAVERWEESTLVR